MTTVASGGFTPPHPRGIFPEADFLLGNADENTPRMAMARRGVPIVLTVIGVPACTVQQG